MKWKSVLIVISIWCFSFQAFADFEQYQQVLKNIARSFQSKGVEKIEFRQPEMIPFGGMEIAELYVKFSNTEEAVGLGIITLKQGFMHPEIPLNEVEAAISGLISKKISHTQQSAFRAELPVIDLFAADHLKKATDFYRASLNDPLQSGMNDPIASAAAISENIMLNAGLAVRVQSVVDLTAEQAKLPVSMSDTAIKKITYVHTRQQMNVRIELHVGLNDDVPKLSEKILDQAQSKFLARYADAFPFLTGNLRTRAIVIKLSSNDFDPLPEQIGFNDFSKHGLFSDFFGKLPQKQKSAIEQLFSSLGGSSTSVNLISNLNLLFVKFRNGGDETTGFLNLISALIQLHAVQYTDVCSRLFTETP